MLHLGNNLAAQKIFCLRSIPEKWSCHLELGNHALVMGPQWRQILRLQISLDMLLLAFLEVIFRELPLE